MVARYQIVDEHMEDKHMRGEVYVESVGEGGVILRISCRSTADNQRAHLDKGTANPSTFLQLLYGPQVDQREPGR